MRHTAHGNAGSDGCHTGHDGDMPRRRRCRTCGGGGQHRGIQRDHRHTQRAGQPAVHIRIFGADACHNGHIHAQAGSVSGDGHAERAVPRRRPAERRQGRHGRVRQGRLLLFPQHAYRNKDPPLLMGDGQLRRLQQDRQTQLRRIRGVHRHDNLSFGTAHRIRMDTGHGGGRHVALRQRQDIHPELRLQVEP